MSQWQNQTWYQQNPSQSTPTPIKTDQQYAYQIPAQAVAAQAVPYGRPYVPSDYDTSTMGKSRASPLIANVSGMQGVHTSGNMQNIHSLQAESAGNTVTGSAQAQQSATQPTPGVPIGAVGGTGVFPGGTGLMPTTGALPLTQLQHAPGTLASLAPVGGLLVAPMLAGPQGTPQYMQVPVQGNYHPRVPGEYSNYQGSNFQLHPDQWDQLAVGLRKPGENSAVAPPAPMKRKSSKGAASTSPSTKDSVPTTTMGGTNPANKVTKRSRMGCLTCRQRKKRCCESKPKCTECLRLGLNCVWPKPGTEHKNKPKEVKREENMIDHDVYGKIRVLRGIVEYRSS